MENSSNKKTALPLVKPFPFQDRIPLYYCYSCTSTHRYYIFLVPPYKKFFYNFTIEIKINDPPM